MLRMGYTVDSSQHAGIAVRQQVRVNHRQQSARAISVPTRHVDGHRDRPLLTAICTTFAPADSHWPEHRRQLDSR